MLNRRTDPHDELDRPEADYFERDDAADWREGGGEGDFEGGLGTIPSRPVRFGNRAQELAVEHQRKAVDLSGLQFVSFRGKKKRRR